MPGDVTPGDAYADEDWSYYFGANPPSGDTLRFSGDGVFRALTVSNQSSRLVAVYLGPNAGGTPAFTIPPGTFVTSPIASRDELTLAFFAQKGGADSGTVYVHGCSTPLSASSGIAGTVGAAGIVFDYSSFDTGAAFSG